MKRKAARGMTHFITENPVGSVTPMKEKNPFLLCAQFHVNVSIRKKPSNKRLIKRKVVEKIEEWLCDWVNETVTGEFGGGEWGDDVHVTVDQ